MAPRVAARTSAQVLPTSLFPFLEYARGHAQYLRKPRLGETVARPRLRYRRDRNAVHPRGFARLHFKYRMEQLFGRYLRLASRLRRSFSFIFDAGR